MRRALLVLAALLVVGLLVVALFPRLVLWAMTPGGAFDPASVPRPPDYAEAGAWTARPDLVDEADAAIAASPAGDQAAAPVDVFYVHPTSYIGSRWNAPVDDRDLNAATDRASTRIQASAFNACCAVWGPRYRQANGTAFTHPSDDGRRALELAYGDVARAFRAYLALRPDRPFVLAGHSQGTVLAGRLLRQEVSGTPARARLVAAYLPGAPLVEASLPPDVPVCASATQTGCAVVWNARAPGHRPGPIELRLGGIDPSATPASPAICVNPLTWTRSEEEAPPAAHPGALFLDAASPAILPGFAGAACRSGTLVVDLRARPPRDLMSRLLDRALGEGNLHPIEYQLFYMSIRRNVAERVAAFARARAGG